LNQATEHHALVCAEKALAWRSSKFIHSSIEEKL
jgi:hypothetical protein